MVKADRGSLSTRQADNYKGKRCLMTNMNNMNCDTVDRGFAILEYSGHTKVHLNCPLENQYVTTSQVRV